MTSDKLKKANELSGKIKDLKNKISDIEASEILNVKIIGKYRDATITEKDIVSLVLELSASMLKRKLATLEKEFDEL